jgi:arylsulfatase A-like enzyme
MPAAGPNLLIVYTDQQSSWTIGAYGGEVVPTPNTDRIAAEGALFSNFFTNSAVCSPSRGCFFTGRYPHVNGVYHNNIPINRDEITLAATLAEHGYETGYAGKWHLDELKGPGWIPPELSMGFADCRHMFNSSHAKGVIDAGGEHPELSADPEVGRYMTDWLADRAIEFIERERSAPFFYVVGIPDPHEPYRVRRPYADAFRPEDMRLPSTFAVETDPSWARENLEGCGSCRDHDDPELHLRRTMAAYCGQVKCIDDNVGRILECLERRGLLEDTVVVFTTDHGDYMGVHGLYGKNRVFEEVYRIPMLIRWPERISARTVVDGFVTTVDFKQTALGLMGLPATGNEQGRDASPLVRGESPKWTDEAHFHHSHFDFAGIFTPEFELGLHRGGEHVLFDRRRDPYQTRNLIDDAACRPAARELLERVLAHNRAVTSPALLWLEKVGL